MIVATTTAAAPPAEKPAPKSERKHRAQGPRTKEDASREAKRMAACILEVLGGARTPTEAAKALAISVPRYYLLETRALNGLLEACEPRPLGRVRSTESELAAAQKEAERLKRECARYAALVRVAQRAVGIAAPPPPPKPGVKGKGKGPRKRMVRALKAATLMKPVEPADVASPAAK